MRTTTDGHKCSHHKWTLYNVSLLLTSYAPSFKGLFRCDLRFDLIQRLNFQAHFIMPDLRNRFSPYAMQLLPVSLDDKCLNLMHEANPEKGWTPIDCELASLHRKAFFNYSQFRAVRCGVKVQLTRIFFPLCHDLETLATCETYQLLERRKARTNVYT